jgi:hypothetical protein
MKPLHESLILLLVIVMLSATCGFVAFHITAITNRSNVNLIFRFQAIEDQLKSNSSAIQEIQQSVTSLKQELRHIAAAPSSRRTAESTDFRANTFRATLIQANLEDQESMLIPTPEQQPQQQKAFNPFRGLKTPDEYWQSLQEVANTRKSLKYDPDEKRDFLEDGADLIQKYEEARASYGIDYETIPSIEAKAGADPIKAIETLSKMKKDLLGYISEAKQYCRELDAMLDEPTKVRLPSRTSYLPVATGSTSKQNYSHLRIDSLIEFAQDGNILATIYFMYRAERGGMPYVAQVSDIINLRNMASLSGEYIYPDYFQAEIQQYVHQQWRFQNLKWNTQPTALDLQRFLSYVGK